MVGHLLHILGPRLCGVQTPARERLLIVNKKQFNIQFLNWESTRRSDKWLILLILIITMWHRVKAACNMSSTCLAWNEAHGWQVADACSGCCIPPRRMTVIGAFYAGDSPSPKIWNFIFLFCSVDVTIDICQNKLKVLEVKTKFLSKLKDSTS